MNNSKIWLSKPHMGNDELSYINEAFNQNWIAPLGPNVDGFEGDLSKYLGNENQPLHVSAFTSGTAALHLALILNAVTSEDIVLVQSFTFCGTSNPVKYLGAQVVFIDSETETWNMCPEALETAIKKYHNQSIKAIIPVHLYGMPANIQAISEIAQKYDIPIIEDAAEALGSSYKDQKCGSFGDMSILSFNGNKIITTSGGGALVSKDAQIINRARFLSTQARDAAPHYQHSEIGYNYRMSNILAGIGRGQMKVLDERVNQRRANNKKYRNLFKDIPGVSFQNEPNSDYFSNYWLSAILIDPDQTGGISREDLRLALEKENIESRPLWKPMHLQPVYAGSDFIGSGVCEDLFEKGLCLPSSSNLTSEEFQRIAEAIKSVFKL